ncbi:nicotinate-nucleotide--dimethylbenzimidazole phosphoribosyltransferase [Sediminibacterium sp.]|uniref:nicotinate-nucleotide--dimethylbenzimidazole phosphoribosyltransferase n=1 Tax=Sediminibacterium sp. TaxID=1917865 RepID=UPI00272F3B95|nr:nicotinate-nucleotide--dimethylbenzimidazole phosphoribosyltransferase [Sediminibacterium sp.]MDP2421622.1 nicotinate-nucleotide--dimethylbenzimidazole phosphoribosyltransferase [Sediminibacterium sp.]
MLQDQLQNKINSKTKPLGALGLLEEIALQVGLIQQTTEPFIARPTIMVFAADHGIAETGLVNPYPQSVTAQMVLNFLNGGAAINVFTQMHQLQLLVVDAGVNADLSHINDPHFIHAKQGMGTANYVSSVAMSEHDVQHCINQGKALVNTVAAGGCNCIGFGEMGIGNTSSAALIMHAITGIPLAACVGRGTGANDAQLITKINTLEKVAAFHQLHLIKHDPLQILSKIGGFEIAMMVGAYLGAKAANMVIVVDGFIATAALLIAVELDPSVLSHCIFAHCSNEQAHAHMLHHLKVDPLLNLGLRLGEGTGAALAIPLIESAVAFLNQMASFEDAGVSKSL